MADLAGVLADLRAEGAAVDALVADLPDETWRRLTPAAGWTVAHQIGHLAWTDAVALRAATDAHRFQETVDAVAAAPYTFVDESAGQAARQAPAQLLSSWRAGRERLADALADVPPGVKLPWFGPPMGAVSMATARLMETWAHGLDIADALDAALPATARLRHVAHLGVRTRDFAHLIRGLQPPGEPFRIELTGPAGEAWCWGPATATERVTGPALDFCLLVTQRRHRADLRVAAVGEHADRWLDIAQTFAGPPGTGREPAEVESGATP